MKLWVSRYPELIYQIGTQYYIVVCPFTPYFVHLDRITNEDATIRYTEL